MFGGLHLGQEGQALHVANGRGSLRIFRGYKSAYPMGSAYAVHPQVTCAAYQGQRYPN